MSSYVKLGREWTWGTPAAAAHSMLLYAVDTYGAAWMLVHDARGDVRWVQLPKLPVAM